MRRVPGSERPIRSQLLWLVLAGIVLLAVPLYLLRRPSPNVPESTEPPALGFGGVIRTELDAGTRAPPVVLGPAQRVRCGLSASQIRAEGSLCDALPPFESALSRAIQGSVDCAPRSERDGTINYVLEIDFAGRRLDVFAGKSGQWRGARVKRAVACVQRDLPAVDWARVPHQHQYYAIAIMATYPTEESVPRLPTFE